jgi:predicted amidohydrolase
MMKKFEKIKISIAQIAPVLGEIDKNISKHQEYIEKAIANKSNLVVFPELSLTGYSLKDAVYEVALHDSDKNLDIFKALSKKISIVIGLVELGEGYQFYNSTFFYEDGKLIAKHRKVYLPTYALFEEGRYFSPGTRFRSFTSKNGVMGMLICEDMWHPTSGVILAQDGASVLLVSTAGISRGIDHSEQPENVRTWEALNKSLAITTTSFILFANRVGVEDGLTFWGGSELVDPNGNRVAKAPYLKEALLETEIDPLLLKHARMSTTLLSDENISLVIDELNRINKKRKEY